MDAVDIATILLFVAAGLFFLGLPWLLERSSRPARRQPGLTADAAERLRRRT